MLVNCIDTDNYVEIHIAEFSDYKHLCLIYSNSGFTEIYRIHRNIQNNIHIF